MVSDKLESADYLSDGEESEALGEDDTAGGELGVADAGDVAGGLLGAAGLDGLGYGVGDLAGLSDALPSALVEGLEGGGGAINTLVSYGLGGCSVSRSRIFGEW